MPTFLITGAGGFIGSSLASKLIKQPNNKVITIDNFKTGFKENVPEGVILIEGDCSNSKIISKLKKYQIDYIFHIAGQSSGEISFEDPIYDLETNTKSTLLLLEFAKKNNCKKFIYASTMSVYGSNNHEIVTETDSLVPKSFYAIGKIASEGYMRLYCSSKLKCYALRLFNVYGPGQNMLNQKQGMVSIFMSQAYENKYIHVKGSKNRFRDFIYIDDIVNAFISVYESQINSNFEVYNVSCNQKTYIYQLINEIKKYFPEEVTVDYKGNTPGDQFGIYGNNQKLISHTNWNPTIELNKGIKAMVKWYLKN